MQLSPLRSRYCTHRAEALRQPRDGVDRRFPAFPFGPVFTEGSEQAIMQQRTCERKIHMSVTVQALWYEPWCFCLLFSTRARIQEENALGSNLLEIEHLGDGVGNPIEGPLANALTVQPIAFNEADEGSLVGHRVVHEILPRPR